ncbi:MAG: DUF1289 domain-containing protein [Methyloprofundus sp.]|nr:DUF1289 domain-containing protein [Methyloprofundus sp.]MDT8425917.1 DUF1289 domain-containing protein [Methyloprofundus sp.]
MKFNPCKGGVWCEDTGTHCNGCGRSHEEIAQTRELMKGLVEFAQKQAYENTDDFAQFIGATLARKLQKP